LSFRILLDRTGAGGPAQFLYTQEDQLLTIDNPSFNEIQRAFEEKRGCFHRESRGGLAVAWMKPSGHAGSAATLDIPAARPGGFREGSRRMTPSSSAQITLHGFAFALILKPDLSVRPLKI
jgi:hypothetical protein